MHFFQNILLTFSKTTQFHTLLLHLLRWGLSECMFFEILQTSQNGYLNINTTFPSSLRAKLYQDKPPRREGVGAGGILFCS